MPEIGYSSERIKLLLPWSLLFCVVEKQGGVVWSDEDIDKHEPAGHMEKAPPHTHHVKFPDAKVVKRSSLKQAIYKSTRIRLVSDFALATRMLEDYGEINPKV